jgi:hypothetical protein
MARPGTAACAGLDIPGSAASTRAGPLAAVSSPRTTYAPRESPAGALAFACAGAYGSSTLVAARVDFVLFTSSATTGILRRYLDAAVELGRAFGYRAFP